MLLSIQNQAKWCMQCEIVGRIGRPVSLPKKRVESGRGNVDNNQGQYTRERMMRTSIVIDDQLMEETLRLSGLRLLGKFSGQAKVKNYRGKLPWIGDLDRMRRDR